jgi:hypothetical protein
MTHAVRFVAVVAVLAALVLCRPVQAQTPDIDALRVRAEAGDAEAQYSLAFRYTAGLGTHPQDHAVAMRWYRLAADQGHAGAQYNLGARRAARAGSDNGSSVNWGVSDADWVRRIFEKAAFKANTTADRRTLIEAAIAIGETTPNFSMEEVLPLLRFVCKEKADFVEAHAIVSESDNREVNSLASEIRKMAIERGNNK